MSTNLGAYHTDTRRIDEFRIATHKENPILISILEKGMSEVSEQEYLDIARRWQSEYQINNKLGLTSEERSWLAKNNVIKVAADPAFYPIEMIDSEGDFSGISGDYLNKIGEILNIQFEWIENKNWSEGLEKIKLKEAHIVSTVSPTETREEFLNFSDSYMTVSQVIFAKESGDINGNLDSLIGKKIAQVTDFAITDRIKNDYPNIEMIEVGSAKEALRLVENGTVDAHISSIPLTSYNIAAEGLTNIVVVGDTPYMSSLTIGTHKDFPLLTSAIQKALLSITPIERAEISRKWLSLTITQKQNYTLALVIFGIALMIVILVLIWNYSLRREVTHRKKIQKELTISQEEAKILQIEAEDANEAKSTFLANMSHEIRTPLNAIIGFSDAITSGIYGEVTNQKHKEYIYDIKDSGEHLSVLIKDILDLSKIGAGKWELNETEFDLGECAKSALKVIMTLAEEKKLNIAFNCAPSPTIKADEHAIKRVLINLFSNAVKFTHSGGEIECSISKDHNGSVSINIKDNGIGIPANQLEQVLLPFGQNHEIQDSNEAGTGLGLPIVKQLVELHSGSFTLNSNLGIGTDACINLPATRVIA
ncbi:MAG: transporter substrate-binding domain-containing protein [Kordiimonadaceae bacterium]|nr:transporter substrate-binding domain-containing protein [Kordiimonadaceae bacterium]MBT6031223.1 transporter substrate-binding domain-containing protein [Kordiimonadaceae bacterium]